MGAWYALVLLAFAAIARHGGFVDAFRGDGTMSDAVVPALLAGNAVLLAVCLWGTRQVRAS
jgi:hypothetical protein